LLKKHPELFIKKAHDDNACYVADINFGMSDYGIMKYYIERTNLIKQQFILQIKIEILKDSVQPEKRKEKLRKDLEKRLEKVEKAKIKNEIRYQKFLEKSKQTVVKAFVTFKSMEGKLRFMKLYDHSWLSRKLNKKKQQELYFEDKYLDVRHPTHASLILWENLGVTKKERCLRVFLVAIVSFIIMILTFIIIVYARDFQSSLSEKYGDSNCPSDTVLKIDAYNDQLKDRADRTGLMH